MRIAFIGAGNVATVLARLLKNAGHAIVGVYSAGAASAAVLAKQLGAAHFDTVANVVKNADVYILATSDGALAQLSKTLKLPGKMVLHTSGATPKEVLGGISAYYGVLYPLQSLRKEAGHQPVIPLLIDGSDNIVKEQVRVLAESISFVVQEADDTQRLNLHLAAVFVSNFTNCLYALAEDYCNSRAVPFDALVPLIKEVAERTAVYSPAGMQTGPAVRGDAATIQKHLQLLAAYPQQQRVYAQMTESIAEFFGRKQKSPPENWQGVL